MDNKLALRHVLTDAERRAYIKSNMRDLCTPFAGVLLGALSIVRGDVPAFTPRLGLFMLIVWPLFSSFFFDRLGRVDEHIPGAHPTTYLEWASIKRGLRVFGLWVWRSPPHLAILAAFVASMFGLLWLCILAAYALATADWYYREYGEEWKKEQARHSPAPSVTDTRITVIR